MSTQHDSSGRLVADPATISTPTEEATLYLERAFSLHSGLTALAPLGGKEATAAIFLASWCLEITLKAYLLTQGLNKEKLEKYPTKGNPKGEYILHNLAELWAAASEHHLPIAETPPDWCARLSKTHKGPYTQRYPTAGGGRIDPNIQMIVTELSKLTALVQQHLQSTQLSQ